MEKLISELESLKLSSAEFRTGSYNEGINAALRLLKSSLPTQQEKVVVPDFIKSTMEQYGSLQEMLTEEYYTNNTDEIYSDKVFCWIDDNFDLLCRAWLDMPKTDVVVVPEFVAEWIEYCKECSWSLRAAISFENFGNFGDKRKLKKWFLDGKGKTELFARACLDGYTVEKEQLYYVPFGYDRFLVKGNAKLPDGTGFIWIETWEYIEQNNYEKLAKFTEQEIKAIDKRYWAFAVPVEEEE